MRTRANGVKFAHQSLCNPKISTLLKAVWKGFIKGCPNLTKKLILKFLNQSPATAKGHMKIPCHGIKSTQPKTKVPWNSCNTPPIAQAPPANMDAAQGPAFFPQGVIPILITDDCKESIANIFCFGAFADRHSGVVYNNLTGNFPFMSFDGSVCFLVMYHYETNAIMGMPIAGLEDVSIFNAYKQNFNELTQKGYKPRLNVMDNQATKHIKKFLTKEECKFQLVKPHNHSVNTAERPIQTFKDAFIAALATNNQDFPLQLWDEITPQVINTLNMMCTSHVNPTKSAYKILNSVYNWNCYPLAPLGCKAVIYKDGDTRGSWASRGVDRWYFGPSMDHYRCNLCYVPETWGYCISGSTKLFLQHCQLPDMFPHQHLQALTNELTEGATEANNTTKGRRLLCMLRDCITSMLPSPSSQEEQRVEVLLQWEAEQRAINATPILTIPQITDAR